MKYKSDLGITHWMMRTVEISRCAVTKGTVFLKCHFTVKSQCKNSPFFLYGRAIPMQGTKCYSVLNWGKPPVCI